MRFKTDYLSRRFVILPAFGFVKGNGKYRYRIFALWGFWRISIGLGKPLWESVEATYYIKEDS